MKKNFSVFLSLMIFISILLINSMEIKAQTCYSYWPINNPPTNYLTDNIGIHTNGIAGFKSLHIMGNTYQGTVCMDPTLRLSYGNQTTDQFGHLTILTGANNIGNEYTSLSGIGNLVLSAGYNNTYTGNNTNDLILAVRNPLAKIRFDLNNSERMTLLPNGNAGINNTNPPNLFQVGNYIGFDNDPFNPLQQEIRFNCKYVSGYSLTPINTNYASIIRSYQTGHLLLSVSARNPEDGYVYFGEDSGILLRGDEDNGVGIGIELHGLVSIGPTKYTPIQGDLDQTMVLSVDGAMVAKEILVEITQNKWSDFVFDKDYKLTPLIELEKNIKQNNKLPGIPSAVEISQTGMNVANMNAKLLQKIEELTLYCIDLQKQCNELKSQINGNNVKEK